MKSLIEYISEKQKLNKMFFIKNIEVLISDSLESKLDFKKLILMMTDKVPSFLLDNVKTIMIGPTPELKKRNLQGLYKDKVIYITGTQPTELEALDDLIHEISHSIEDLYNNIIYSDEKIKKEFLLKRKKLKHTLERSGYEVSKYNFLQTKYEIKFDNFLYKGVGYEKLGILTSEFLYSPYAATSLREYFANGFEAFYMKEEVSRLKRISPELFRKIIILNNNPKEKNDEYI